MRNLILFFSVLSISIPIGIEGQMNIALLQEKLDSIITNGIDSMAYPGATVYILRDGKELYYQTYGYHTYEKIKKVKKGDIYDFASVTKVSSGLPILMKLYGEGDFNLDASLKKYYPSFRKTDMGKLTFRAMLAHQAGLQPYIVFWRKAFTDDGHLKKNTFSFVYSENFPIKLSDRLFLHKDYKEKMIKEIAKAEVEENPEYKYSGLLFLLLPDILSGMVKDDYETYLYENFFIPMGLELAYNPRKHFSKERIIPTENDTFFRYHQIHAMVHDEAAAMLSGISCNAGLFGSAESLGRLFQMYLNGGTLDGQEYIPAEAIKEFTRYQYPDNDNRRGLGFDKPPLDYIEGESYIARDASPSSFGHSGFTGTFVWADPEYNLVFVFMSNRVYPTRENRKLYEMEIRPKIHQLIYDYCQGRLE